MLAPVGLDPTAIVAWLQHDGDLLVVPQLASRPLARPALVALCQAQGRHVGRHTCSGPPALGIQEPWSERPQWFVQGSPTSLD